MEAGSRPGTGRIDLDQTVAALRGLLFARKPEQELPEALRDHPGFVALFTDLAALQEQLYTLSKGELGGEIRQRGFLAGCLRSLQANLRHIAWQTQMVAAGNFAQRVEFLGDFSKAFNTMTEALAKVAAELKESERRYRLLAENVADVIITVDHDGRFTYVSPSVTRLLGYTPEELMGHTVEESFQSESAHPFPEMLNHLLSHEEEARRGAVLEVRLPRKDGTVVWTESTIAALRQETGLSMGLIAVIRDVSGRKQLQDDLIRLATIDPATGAFNRRHFLALGAQEMDRATRHSTPVSLIIMDVDHFKQINDTHGHAAGDAVLRAVVEIGRKTLRSIDVFGRFGGDEFTVLLPSTNAAGAVSVAERLRRAYESATVSMKEGGAVSFTISAGVAERGREPIAIEELIQRADSALYRAKNGGRNRVEVY